MTTIINTPPTTTEDSSASMVIGIIFGALVVILLLIFGIPYLRGRTVSQTEQAPSGATTINVTIPTVTPASSNGTNK